MCRTENTTTLRDELKGLEELGLKVVGDPHSPLIHLRLRESRGSRDADNDLLETFVTKVLRLLGMSSVGGALAESTPACS